MEDGRELEIIEYGVEALLIGAFTYLFAYQNYLLYRWHRGLELPAKWPFYLLGILVGIAFFVYKSNGLLRGGKSPSAGSEIDGQKSEEAENADTGGETPPL